jgi:hypothetical protein
MIEDVGVVDYTFRIEKMFDYMQIDNEGFKRASC